jgi:hypothetical protein
MKNKTKKSPTGAPLGNPLKYFREGGEKTKAMFKKGGYNTPTQELKKAQYGDAGSGMGRMAADDAAFDAMMATPATKPTLDPVVAAKLAEASAAAARRSAIQDQIMKAPANVITPTRNTQLENYGTSPYKNKKGGSVKRKKK